MNLDKYISDFRRIVNDNPTNIDPRNTDEDVIGWINDARREISKDLKSSDVIIKQHYIIPELYIDEYALPMDFMQSREIYDVYNQVYCLPSQKEIAESSKSTRSILDGNRAYINENRRKIIFEKEFESSQLEENYLIYSFDRTNKKIVIDGIKGTGTVSINGSAYVTGSSTMFLKELLVNCNVTIDGETKTVNAVVNDICATVSNAFSNTASSQTMVITPVSRVAKWNTRKSFARLTSASGEEEFVRISKILADTPSAGYYTLMMASDNLKLDLKNNVKCYGLFSCVNTNTMITGSGTYFERELNAGEKLNINGQSFTLANVISNIVCHSTTAMTATETNVNAYVTSLPTFANDDLVKFIPYVMDYVGEPKDMEMYYEEDTYPIDIQDLVPLRASVYAEKYRGREDFAIRNYNEYEKKLEKIRYELNKEANDYRNKRISRSK